MTLFSNIKYYFHLCCDKKRYLFVTLLQIENTDSSADSGIYLVDCSKMFE